MERTPLTESLPALDAADAIVNVPRDDLTARFPGATRRDGAEVRRCDRQAGAVPRFQGNHPAR